MGKQKVEAGTYAITLVLIAMGTVCVGYLYCEAVPLKKLAIAHLFLVVDVLAIIALLHSIFSGNCSKKKG